ncbi:methylated-DNA--[protein]-cysteine S-methyltransferase [Bacteroides sp. UBA939]|uniref:methylated-DNA--[protein]-cysteine S-methyltransferase n=1 Tax=Bacteroides sp. UBA939 TaxID=1946092 RepID=UPI0025BAAC9B|nr:methylated-DNA--[protein]-cysteine S-methyltransferase [Bacteroides sp. UBA939]
MKVVWIQPYQSPCGELILGSFEGKLCLCDWQNGRRRELIDKRIQKNLRAQYETGMSETIRQTIIRLDEYFARQRTTFDIPLLFTGTDFQKTVWRELQNIPYGKTISYAELSGRLGNPKAVRAIASANGANAISVLVPCHRVIGSNHKLVGYGGGLPVKKMLLELESNEKLLL